MHEKLEKLKYDLYVGEQKLRAVEYEGNPFETKGALLYRTCPCIEVRPAELTTRTPECPGCFESLRFDKDLRR